MLNVTVKVLKNKVHKNDLYQVTNIKVVFLRIWNRFQNKQLD